MTDFTKLLIVFFFLALFKAQGQTIEIKERITQIELRVTSGELSEEKMFSHFEWLIFEYATLGDLEKVRFWFGEAIAFARERKPDAEQRFFVRMGSIFSNINKSDSAEIYFTKALQLLENSDNFSEKANVYELIGNHHAEQNNPEEAVNSFMIALEMNEIDKSAKIERKIDIKQNIKTEVRIRLNMEVTRGIMLNHGQILEAFLYVKKLIDENSDIDFTFEEYIIDSNIADEYIYSNEHEKALDYAKEALKKALIYAAMGDQKKATENIALYEKLKAEISDEKMHHAVKNMEVKYKVQQKEHEIERQQNEINRHQARQYMFIMVLLALGVLLLLLMYIIRLHNLRNQALTDRNDTLAEINATKDKFFSIISHDLKNPAIDQRNAVRMLMENGSSWSAATLQKYYGKLLKSAENEVELIYNLLNWAQVQTDRLPFNPIPFDIVSNLSNDIAIACNLADKKNITLHIETNNAPSVPVIGDSTMICTVVRNLLTNAVKFTPAGGEVTLTVLGAHAGASQQKTCITVADTGLGMTGEQITNLFRLDNKHSQQGTAGEPGSGLGLIVCKELIEKHGSTLNIESQPGQGTRFWFDM